LCNAGKKDKNGKLGAFFLETWLNKTEVRNALHVPDYVQPWEDCVASKWWDYTEQMKGSLYAWKALKDDGTIKMLKFSGDKDGVVATPGTINWINAWLDEPNSTIAPEQEAWAPYDVTNQYNGGKQVAGYHWKLNGMTFATVHGAGHMVPTDQPQVAQ